MIPVMWFIVAVVMSPSGPAKVMSQPMPTKEICLQQKEDGDSKIKEAGLVFESKCVMFGGVQA